MIAQCDCVMSKKYETTLRTRRAHLCKYLFSHDIPDFQNDNFHLNAARQIQECFYETKLVSHIFQNDWLYFSHNSYGM